MFLVAISAHAADTPPVAESLELQACLKKADDLPDIAAADATVWIRKGGGNDAHLCHAAAQSNRGMHADAAREYWSLAAFYDKHDKYRGILMHNQSGQEFLRAKDIKNAWTQFGLSLKNDPNNIIALVGRARADMEDEKYWDALVYLNRVLKRDPDAINALRQRGLVWEKLGNDKNAQEDFVHAEALSSH
jgi:tetratricopeptide (TPR) repeat protein